MRTFALILAVLIPAAAAEEVTAAREGKQIVVRSGDKEILRYQAEPGELPRQDIPEVYRRGGYIASIHTPIAGGELITPPLIFQGKSLSMNFASSAFGSLRVEIQNADGKPLPGFALADSIELYGDTVARNALWKNNPDLDALSGKPVRLRFVMRDADLYSIKFEESK